ncbi:hypothetical protein [Agrococcus casei]|uniref:TPR-repeat-containing protein n=1 Tax=Agrococcus casei LMG 22410 TaxID=1255656 RepID=A0A1R4GJM0_9MICO|nr:hypothetical protein [Agrococcus casei]SJM68320.1 TPR-repeat-containing protein [Agrococcus casei LMG 22410]
MRNHAQRGGRDREDDGMPDLRPVRERFRAPDLPADVTPDELDGIARMQLKTLQKENADVAAMHLAMTARLIDDDPELAHQHALAASRTAGRIGVVRETLGITAYTTGDFALALRELRTYRRITGNDDQIPLMVDCERGLSRPEKALELARSVDASKLDTEVRVELAIAKSGARLDLGQAQEALEELRIPELDRTRAFDYSPALFAAHATVLEELGRTEESAEWFALSDKAVDALENAYLEKGTEEVSIEEERLPEPEPELEPEQEQESDEAVADEVVVDEAVADEAPVEVEEAAADESPVEAAPVEEAPVAEAPVSEDEAAPVAEVSETPADAAGAADADDAEDDIALFDFKED